jgi:hypothetical protein
MSSIIYQISSPYTITTTPFAYTVYTTGGNFYARNGLTGLADNPTIIDAATVINYALANA